MEEVVVGGEQGQVMAYAKLGQQGINRADLNAGPTAGIAQLRSVDVILPIRADQWQGGKAFDDVLARTWTSETLKQFLQNEPCRHDNIVTLEGVAQRAHLRAGGTLVSPESE
jgi:hypothetical protein